MKGFLKGFLMGFLVVPAALGLLVIFHVFIDSKSDGHGGEITNRIARTELVWLAMNKPKLFCDSFEWVCEDVEEHHDKTVTPMGSSSSGSTEPESSIEKAPDQFDGRK